LKPVLISIALGYVLGSIPFGYLLVRAFHGEDVRTTGSGNIGATNVARRFPGLGAATLLLDALKGLGPVLLISRAFPDHPELPFVTAFAAVAGHIFPIWLKFRGGKGVATGLGSFLLLTPKAILVALLVFVLVLAAFRFVALGSVVAAAALPFAAYFFLEGERPAGIAMITAASLLIILKHHTNIRRMLNHTESKFLD